MKAGSARRAWTLRLILPLALVVVVVAAAAILSFDHFAADSAEATGPGMSLNVVGATSCDDPTKPTSCDIPFSNPFNILINTNPSPAVEISGFSAEVVFPSGLTYTRSSCPDEVQVGRQDMAALSFCQSFDTAVLGGAGISVLSAVAFPVPALAVPTSSVTTLVELDFTCTTAGSHKVTLTAAPSFPDGANYSDTLAGEINVKTIQQDVDGNTTLDSVADTLLINCVLPPTTTPVPTPTRTPTPLPPTPTFTPTNTPPPTSTPTPTGDTVLTINKFSSAVLVGGACFDVVLFPGPGSFQVCDNNIQTPDTHPACLEDGTSVCDDLDPTSGLISVAVAPGFYDVFETKAPLNHMLDTSLQLCDPRPGLGCAAVFVDESPSTNPSFPWDVTGDGAVAFADFLDVLQHFGERQP